MCQSESCFSIPVTVCLLILNDKCECNKQIKKIEITWESFYLSDCECELRRRQHESLYVVIGLNVNVLLDGHLLTHRAAEE